MPQIPDCIRDSMPNGRALGKCVSASHICQAQRPIVTIINLSRSQNALSNTPVGYILRADGKNINITKVDDINEWLDPPQPLKRISPDSHLNTLTEDVAKTRKVEDKQKPNGFNENLPCFLRNQSVDELESETKRDIDAPLPFCRHFSIPDNCEVEEDNDTDSSDDDLADMCDWYRNVSSFKKLDKMDVDQPKNILAGIVKKGENLLAKKSSYDVTDANVRNTECLRGNDRKLSEIDSRRYNGDCIKKNPVIPEGVRSVPKNLENQKNDKLIEKSNFFSKKLLSPKLSRLFKPNTAEVQRNKLEIDENKEEKSRSKFFIQHPVSPNNICRSYRVRPVDEVNVHLNDNKNRIHNNVLKSDIKLANMGKPMTPIFRRHVPTEKNDFVDGRFSYRERRQAKFENRIKPPIINNKIETSKLPRNNHLNNIPSLANVKDKSIHSILDCKVDDDVPLKKRESGISRSNYVSLANLKINSRSKNIEKSEKNKDDIKERVVLEKVT